MEAYFKGFIFFLQPCSFGAERAPKRLRLAHAEGMKRLRMAAREQVRCRVGDIGSSASVSSDRLPAQVRLERLRERVRARERRKA